MRDRTIPAMPERSVKEDIRCVEFDFKSRAINIHVDVGDAVDADGEVTFEGREEVYTLTGADLQQFLGVAGAELRVVRDRLLQAVDILRAR